MRLSWEKKSIVCVCQGEFLPKHQHIAALALAETPAVSDDSPSYLFGYGSHNNCTPTQLYVVLLFPKRLYSPNLSASLDFSPTLDNFKNKNKN